MTGGKNEHSPHPSGPSSLVSMKTPADVYRDSTVSPVQTASGKIHVPAWMVFRAGIVIAQSVYF